MENRVHNLKLLIILISTVQTYTARGHVRVMLIVHVIVTCPPVGPVLEGCLAYFALCQLNIHPHDCSDEPRIDNNLLSAQD